LRSATAAQHPTRLDYHAGSKPATSKMRKKVDKKLLKLMIPGRLDAIIAQK